MAAIQEERSCSPGTERTTHIQSGVATAASPTEKPEETSKGRSQDCAPKSIQQSEIAEFTTNVPETPARKRKNAPSVTPSPSKRHQSYPQYPFPPYGFSFQFPLPPPTQQNQRGNSFVTGPPRNLPDSQRASPSNVFGYPMISNPFMPYPFALQQQTPAPEFQQQQSPLFQHQSPWFQQQPPQPQQQDLQQSGVQQTAIRQEGTPRSDNAASPYPNGPYPPYPFPYVMPFPVIPYPYPQPGPIETENENDWDKLEKLVEKVSQLDEEPKMDDNRKRALENNLSTLLTNLKKRKTS
ncbi:unnamed protein product [Ambrosiozyma monospora]|uniref:Unnamed protein product n=1 Tax=Ambrosiozyma monospora TaxID=43982 RepID=A0ACB5TZR7_AMBMO|nr:unnamed protein product [Ambrosiozyma monospora]